MTLIPSIFSHWWENLDRPHTIMSDFGLPIDPEDFMMMEPPPRRWMDRWGLDRRQNYLRPWQQTHNQGKSVIKPDPNAFTVSLDISHFSPEEITCKVANKFIIIEGKHEERKDDHGYISRQFTRKYLVPEQCDIEQVKSTLSSDGVLTIQVPRKVQPKLENEKVIPIEHTGKPAVCAKPKEAEKLEEKKAEKKMLK